MLCLVPRTAQLISGYLATSYDTIRDAVYILVVSIAAFLLYTFPSRNILLDTVF